MKFDFDMLNVGNADSFMKGYFSDDDKEVVILIDAGNPSKVTRSPNTFKI